MLCLVLLVTLFTSCSGNHSGIQVNYQKKIDSLVSIVSAMKPGLGEYMLSAQIHHNKLWFAGKSGNWDLAKFELDEIKETLDDAIAIETDRPEIKSIPMIYPFLDSLQQAVNQKDTLAFKRNFGLLTNTCNTCHESVHFGFNKIKIPDNPPFTNQNYSGN